MPATVQPASANKTVPTRKAVVTPRRSALHPRALARPSETRLADRRPNTTTATAEAPSMNIPRPRVRATIPQTSRPPVPECCWALASSRRFNADNFLSG